MIEIENRYLWSIQPNRDHDLTTFAQAVFTVAPRLGEMIGNHGLGWLHLWPGKALLLSGESSLPAKAQDFAAMVTDISDGFCELSLTGVGLLEFLNSYTSSDLMETRIAGNGNLRCLLGQYPVVIWWQQITDIRILVDRSYAQSFCDYLEHLGQRWSLESV